MNCILISSLSYFSTKLYLNNTHTNTLCVHIKENQKTLKDPPFILYCMNMNMNPSQSEAALCLPISLYIMVKSSEFWGSDSSHLLNVRGLSHSISRAAKLWLLSFLFSASILDAVYWIKHYTGWHIHTHFTVWTGQ